MNNIIKNESMDSALRISNSFRSQSLSENDELQNHYGREENETETETETETERERERERKRGGPAASKSRITFVGILGNDFLLLRVCLVPLSMKNRKAYPESLSRQWRITRRDFVSSVHLTTRRH